MFKALLRGALDLIAPSRCPGCDVDLDWGLEGFCAACEMLVDPLLRGPACYEYGGPLADGIRRLKYEGRVDLVAPLAALWTGRALMHMGLIDVVIPIPLHPARLQTRGFNPVELLAEPLTAALGVHMDTRRLTRVRDTKAQASLPKAARDANVRGAFLASRDDRCRRILLLDDVRTTGATLNAGVAALYRSGATRVRVMALAGVDDGMG